MKKGLFAGALLSLALVLASCGVSQKSADKVNEAADADEHYTVETLEKEFGEATMDLTLTVLGSTNGILVWVNGCENADEVEAKWEAEEPVEALVVTILNNKAVSASYDENFTEEDSK